MRYRKEREGYLIRLDIEEKVEESLIDLTRRDGIDAAHFWGIGAVKDIVLGYYDLSDKTYRRSDLPGTRDLVSLTGSLAQTPKARSSTSTPSWPMRNTAPSAATSFL